jgi:hypothetical protein
VACTSLHEIVETQTNTTRRTAWKAKGLTRAVFIVTVVPHIRAPRFTVVPQSCPSGVLCCPWPSPTVPDCHRLSPIVPRCPQLSPTVPRQSPIVTDFPRLSPDVPRCPQPTVPRLSPLVANCPRLSPTVPNCPRLSPALVAQNLHAFIKQQLPV